MICRLGVRGVDVKRLRFADLDWPGNRLSVVQAKTGQRVWLPLLKDVGWAIIDYVRDGRPASDARRYWLLHVWGGSGDGGSGVQFADDQVDHRDEVAVGAIATRSAFGSLDQRVEALEQSVGDAAVVPADHALPVVFEHARELLEGREAASVDLGDPASQELLGGVGIVELVEAVELLREGVSADGLKRLGEQLVEQVALLLGELRRPLEPHVPRVLQQLLLVL